MLLIEYRHGHNKNIILRSLFFVLFVILFYPGKGQEINAIYSNAKLAKWFPHQTVRCLYQDSKGIMWIGTLAGLFKYDISNLKHYNLNKKANGEWLNNTINTISEDSYGNILVGTGNSLGILNPDNGHIQIVPATDHNIVDVVTDNSGLIWCLSNEDKIFRIAEYKNIKQPTKILNS